VQLGANRQRPALVLDASLRQSLVAVRSLGRAGVRTFAAETSRGAPAFQSRWCAGSFVLPDFTADPGAFVQRLIALCGSLGSPVVITSHDGTIEVLRARRAQLERVAALALAPERALAAAIDKRTTLAVAERIGVPIPVGVTVTEHADAGPALDALGLPAVVKPVVSWVDAGHGVFRAAPSVAATRADALAQIARLLDGGVGALVQQWLSGSREAVSLLWSGAEAKARFAQVAHRMSPLIGGSSVVRSSIPVPGDIGAMADALARELGLDGYSEIEFRRDRDGRPFLMEINPRLSASVEVAVRAGVAFPELLYRWAAGEPLERLDGYRYGSRMRWLHGDVEWVKEALADRTNPDAPTPADALGTFLGEFARFPGYDFWDRGDVRPAALVAARVARRLPGRVVRKLHRISKRGPAGRR
jgi:predicted ATP-grasp superfamily ATP-dependent carboligase